MRHGKLGKRLGRTEEHRRLMFRNMMQSLIEHEGIKTTVAKAKMVRPMLEKLVTSAKEDTLASRRNAFDTLRDASAVHKLFTEIAPAYLNRPGGYLRILKCGIRAGDTAPMALIQFVEGEEVVTEVTVTEES